ncbi:MAG: hypothetical protein ACFFD1_13480 [Candidatus Thorarchaeota archaeon]
MRCFFCQEESIGICKNCGRGICLSHQKKGPIMIEGEKEKIEEIENEGYLIYELWCGRCVSDEKFKIVRDYVDPSLNPLKLCPECDHILGDLDLFCPNCGINVNEK